MKRLTYLLLFVMLPLCGIATTTHREKQEGEATTGSYHNHHLISESGKLTRTEKNSTVILGGAAQTTISASDLDLGDASSQTLIRGNNIHLGAEYVFSEDMDRKDARNFKYRFEGIQRGVHTTGDGDLAVIAQGKLTGTAAQLHSGQGDISLYGANGVDLTHGQHITKTADASHSKKNRIIKSKTNTEYHEREIRTVVPGSVSAKNVSIVAGKGADLNLAGQYISSDHGTHLQAGNNITVTAGINQEHGIHNASQKKSGLFANFKSGKLGVGYRQSQGHTQEEYERFSLTPSLIASNKGDVTFQAGGKITTRASGVVAGNDILMRARDIDIDVAAVSETGTQQGNSKQRSMGITADLRDPTLKSLQTLFKGLDKNARGNARDTIQGVDKSVLASSMSLIEPPLQDHLTHARGNQQKHSHLIHIGGSALEAVGNIQLQAIGGDLNIIGSQVHGAKGVQLQASRNLNILAAESLASSSSQLNNKVHGHTGGGATVFTGYTMDAASGKASQGKLHASTVTSSGDISLTAGQHYQQTGSHVKSLGNIDLTARTVDIQAAQTHDSQDNRQNHVDKGLSGSLGGNGINQLQAASESVQRLGESQKFRTNLMNAANSIMSGYNAGKAISEGKVSPSITITYGENNSKGEQSRQSSSLEASSLLADGKVRINATGGNLHIGGSDVAGKQGTQLNAQGKIILSAAQQSEHQSHSSSESGWKAGVALTADNGIALGIHAGGHYGKGEGAGESTQWRLTRIGNMNSQTTLRSGEATQLIGAQVSGKGVQLNSKGLHIQSLQNTASYDSESYRIGGDGTIGWGVAAGNLEYGNSKVHHSHQSIDQPSGIFAGADGYQIQVDGHTHLEGGLVTSGIAAEQNGNNSFITKTLTHSGLDNHSRHQGKALAIGIQASTDGNSGSANPNFGFGQDKHNAQSHTASGISTANLHITDAYQQEKLSGQSIAQTQAAIRSDIHLREAESAGSAMGKLANTFNPERLERELQLERDASQAFMQNAPQLVALTAEQLGDLKAHEIRQTAQQLDRLALAQTSDPEQRAILQQRIDKRQQELDANQANYEQWKEGGTARNLLHAAAGGLLAGNWQGAASSYAASASAPALNRLDNPLFNRLAAPAMGALIGAGEMGSIMAAGGTDWNNRRLHDSEIKYIKEHVETFAKQQGISPTEAEKILLEQAMRVIDTDYANTHAVIKSSKHANAAIDYLRQNTFYFTDTLTGEKFLSFAPQGYENHPLKFSDQKGYEEERRWIAQNPGYPQAFKDQEAYNLVRETIITGSIKGAANNIADTILFPVHIKNTLSGKPYEAVIPYKNEAEALVGRDISNIFSNLSGIAGAGIQIAPRRIVHPDLNIGRNNRIYNRQRNEIISERVPASIYNIQSVSRLEKGILPGVSTAGRTGVPREMVSSTNPDATAIDFVKRFAGEKLPPPKIIYTHNNPVYIYVFKHPSYGDTTVTYRPAGSAGKNTSSTTATVEINNNFLNNINLIDNGKKIGIGSVIKLKFPTKTEVK